MLFDPIASTLTLDFKDCTRCYGKGDGPTRIDCPTCKGTGKGARGGRGGCRNCHGNGQAYDHDLRVVCPHCGGAPASKSRETWTDTAPIDAVMSMSLVVMRQDRGGSFNEGFLGLGCLWSCTDYGERWKREDDTPLLEEIAGKLRTDRTQACKIIAGERDRDTETMPLAAGLVIVLHRDGYSLRTATTDNLARAQAEPDHDAGLAIGMAVYHAGGNGTLAAALPNMLGARSNQRGPVGADVVEGLPTVGGRVLDDGEVLSREDAQTAVDAGADPWRVTVASATDGKPIPYGLVLRANNTALKAGKVNPSPPEARGGPRNV